METWIPLLDYSQKYKVSMSTLRRRIKADDLKFRFDEGKYYISDEPLSAHQRTHRPSPISEGSLMGAHVANPAFEARYQQSYNMPETNHVAFDVHRNWASQSATTTAPKSEFRSSGLGATSGAGSFIPKFDFSSSSAASAAASSTTIPNLKEAPPKKDTSEDQVLSVANRLLNELKKAYTQILHEKEEQILILKEEVADLKTLVKVLEDNNDRLQKN